MRWKSEDIRYAGFVSVGTLAFLLIVGVIYPAPPAIIALGLIVGSLSGLVAVGLVLVYRANRIVNFAQGSLGAVAGILAASLIVGPKWPYLPAVAVGLLAALIIGGIVEITLIRRFATAPRLVLTVATIGVAQLLDVGTLGIPKLFNYNQIPQPPQPFHFHFNWFPVVYNGGHVVILIVVPILTAALILFLRRSRIGVAIRASAESSDRAAMLGIPVKRVNTMVWVIASGLSGAGVLLRLPIQGVAIGRVLGPSLLLRALAAAVIGRMESLPRTLAAALALGVVEQAVFFRTGSTIVADAVLFVVILVALLVNRPKAGDRAADRDASSWAAIGLVRPVPRIMRKLVELRVASIAGALVLAGFLLLLPLTWSASRVSLFAVGLIFAILVCSLVVLTGWAGQISLGQVALAAIAACVAGSMAQEGKNFFFALAVASVVGAVVAVLIGIPALRIRGPFLAVTTLAFAQVTGSYIVNEQYFPWLVPDRTKPIPRPILFGKFDMTSEHTTYYVVLLALVFCAAVVWRMRSSRTGRTLLAVRDNARAAQSYGISPTRSQLTAFAVSGWMAGLAGALLAYQQTFLPNSLLDPESSINLFVVAVVGGLASLPGAMLGAAYITWVNFSSFTKQPISQLFASGIGVLAILLFLPGGLGGAVYSLRDRALRLVARRRHLHVPSLVADSLVVSETEVMPAAVADVLAPGTDPLLVVSGVELSYGKAQVLFGVDLHVERGEILALLGTNGAGKSTILSAICGLVRNQKGTITFDGKNITGISPQGALAAGIVLVPGGKAVFPTLSVAEHMRLAGWIHERTDPDHVRAATERALQIFPILRDRWEQRAGNLSGGEQQMLALAQALVAKPRLLMIDELSLGLAPVIVEQLLDIVRAIHESGTTIVLVEQSVNVAASLADRAIFLEKGTVRFSGATEELLGRGDILRAVFLGSGAANGDAASGTSGVVGTGGAEEAVGVGAVGTNGSAADGSVPLDGADTEESKLTVAAGLSAAAHAQPRRPFIAICEHCGHEHKLALEVRELAVHFGGIRAVEGVSFQVRAGEILGLIGPNGAGKTTVLDLISGFLAPSEGHVFLDGDDVTELPPDVRSWRGLGRSFQDARLFATLTVRETIAAALERHVPVRDAMAAFVLSPAVTTSEKEIDERVSELVELMRLEAYADKFVGELSTGSRRIVDLACVLAHGPSVLLLDEPASGIAQREAEALGPVILNVRDRTGAAIVVIEHDMPLISSISDELLALEAGSPIAQGTPEAVLSDPQVVAGYLGSSDIAVNRSGARRSPASVAANPSGAGTATATLAPAAEDETAEIAVEPAAKATNATKAAKRPVRRTTKAAKASTTKASNTKAAEAKAEDE